MWESHQGCYKLNEDILRVQVMRCYLYYVSEGLPQLIENISSLCTKSWYLSEILGLSLVNGVVFLLGFIGFIETIIIIWSFSSSVLDSPVLLLVLERTAFWTTVPIHDAFQRTFEQTSL